MKVGLEVHQQLSTGKLFCSCPSELSEVTTGGFLRRLRPAPGEDRAIDVAAAFQASRGLSFRYEMGRSNCLVEMDEEPPHPLNAEALDVALTFALLVGARPVDEIEVMRKIVVDGSNTTGFQRTALVAVDGEIRVGERRYGIESICLEEDAARKVEERGQEVVYRLDRLGIPLIEVATAPEISSGAEARSVAEEIGATLRATRKVRRGIGTIREDLNVSTSGGTRIEIKGVQELRLIATYVEQEESRQRFLLELRDELIRRGAQPPAPGPTDLSPLFMDVPSGPLSSSSRKDGSVLAIALPGFAGLLGPRPGTEERLGRELADYARSAGLKGLIHSDELPGYGVTDRHVRDVRGRLQIGERDAFVLVAGPSRESLVRALERVAARASAALDGVPGETRDPLPDGRTRYSRPLPGRHRMYPETDIPPVAISKERENRLLAALPERPAELEGRIEREHRLSPEVTRQIVYGGLVDRFETLTRGGHSPILVARLLTQDLPSVVDALSGSTFEPVTGVLEEILRACETGRIAKEGIPAVLEALARGAPTVGEAIARTGLEGLSAEGLRQLVERVVRAQAATIRARGKEAFSPLMGDVMKEVRGRRDGREVAEELRRAIDRELQGSAG